MRLVLLSILLLLLLVHSSLASETFSVDQILIEKNRKTVGSLFHVPSDNTAPDSSRSSLNVSNEVSTKRSLQKLLVSRILQDTGDPRNSTGSRTSDEYVEQNEDVPSYPSKMSTLTTEKSTPNTVQRHSPLGMFERFSMENSNPADENEAEFLNAFNDDVDISADFFSDQTDTKKRNRLEDIYPEIMELPKQETRLPEIPGISDDADGYEPVRKKRNRGEDREEESDMDCDENEHDDEYEYEEETPDLSLPRNEQNNEKKVEKQNGMAKTSARKTNSGKSKSYQVKFSSSVNNQNSKKNSHSRHSELTSSKDNKRPAIRVNNNKNTKKITHYKSKNRIEQTKLNPKSSRKISKLIPAKKNLSKLDNSDSNKIYNNQQRNKLIDKNTTKKKAQRNIRLKIMNAQALKAACCKYNQGGSVELDVPLYNAKRDLQNTGQKQAVDSKNKPEMNKTAQFSEEIKDLLDQLIAKVGDLNKLMNKNEEANESQFTDGSE